MIWNGNSVFVPESMAFEIENLPQSCDPLGMDWATSLNSLPTPPKRTLQTIGIPEPIRQHFQGLDLTSLRQMDPADERYKEIPVRYHSAFPLDDPSAQRRAGGSFGYPSCLYKVSDRADSHIYALRRFDNVRLVSASVLKSVQTKWTAIRHPSIVTLYSIAVEKGAVFFAHAYHPSAQTLKQRFLDPRSHSSSNSSQVVSEALLWRLLAQISAGMRLVHSRGMAVRSLNPSHILLTSGARFRIANVGVVDVLEFESRKSLQDWQMEDVVKLGYLILSVAMRRPIGPKSVEAGMNHLQQSFSQELCRVVAALLTGSRSIDQIICHMMSDKICDELDFTMASSDALHLNLRNEYENGRLTRLLLKLGLINERPEYALAPSWSDTGDRYVLQLFRDYLFHQTDVDGAPQLDMGHVISALNKLDAGDPEQILLSSRNGKDILVVSFGDVRRCFLEDSVILAKTRQLNVLCIRRCLELSMADLLQQAGASHQSGGGVTGDSRGVANGGRFGGAGATRTKSDHSYSSHHPGAGSMFSSKTTGATTAYNSHPTHHPLDGQQANTHHYSRHADHPYRMQQHQQPEYHPQQQQYGSHMGQQYSGT